MLKEEVVRWKALLPLSFFKRNYSLVFLLLLKSAFVYCRWNQKSVGNGRLYFYPKNQCLILPLVSVSQRGYLYYIRTKYQKFFHQALQVHKRECHLLCNGYTIRMLLWDHLDWSIWYFLRKLFPWFLIINIYTDKSNFFFPHIG